MEHDALDVLRSAVERSRRQTTVQLPIDFVRDPSEAPTPLKKIASDGRGQGLRLKLYLSMTMLATKPPFQLRPYPAAAYAKMLALDDAEGQGARRVDQAQRWLRDAGFIQRVENGTHPPHMTLLPLPTVGDWGARWITIPIGVWSNGWIHVMSGRALTMYVVLRELTGGRPGGDSADGRRKRQGLKPCFEESSGEVFKDRRVALDIEECVSVVGGANGEGLALGAVQMNHLAANNSPASGQ